MQKNKKKALEHEGDDDTLRKLKTWNSSQRFGKGSGRGRILTV